MKRPVHLKMQRRNSTIFNFLNTFQSLACDRGSFFCLEIQHKITNLIQASVHCGKRTSFAETRPVSKREE